MSDRIQIYEESHAGWTAKPNLKGGYDILDANGWPLATLHYDYRFTCNATNHFRSNLFAAAPEMLAALKAIVDSWPVATSILCEQAKAAVAKAEASDAR